METLIQFVHALAVAILVGKVVLLSFVVAPILAKNLDREPFGKVVRQLFPAYYGLGMGTAVAGFIAVNGLVAMHSSSARLLIAGGLWILVLVRSLLPLDVDASEQCPTGSAQGAGVARNRGSGPSGLLAAGASTVGLLEFQRAPCGLYLDSADSLVMIKPEGGTT